MINGFSEVIENGQRCGKRWKMVGAPHSITDCEDDTLNGFIGRHTSENGVPTWGSIKGKKTVFNAKSSRVKVLYHGYCLRCNEFFRSSSSTPNKNFKSKCVQRKILINSDKTHLAIYNTIDIECKKTQIPSNYIPQRGFKTDDKIFINQGNGFGSSRQLMAHELTKKGISREVVNKRLRHRNAFLNLPTIVDNGQSLAFTIEMFTKVTFTHQEIVLKQPLHPFQNDECHPLHSLFLIDNDLSSGSNWSYVMLLPITIHDTLVGLSKFHSSMKSIQVQIDFAKGFFDDDVKQLGTVFCNDYLHQAFPILFIICDAKDKTACTMALKTAKEILELREMKLRQVLADRGGAIIYAVASLFVLFVACYTHSVRSGLTRGGGLKGGQGSAPWMLVELVSYSNISITVYIYICFI